VIHCQASGNRQHRNTRHRSELTITFGASATREGTVAPGLDSEHRGMHPRAGLIALRPRKRSNTGTAHGRVRPYRRSVASAVGTVPLAFAWLIMPGLRRCPNTIGTVATADCARPAGSIGASAPEPLAGKSAQACGAYHGTSTAPRGLCPTFRAGPYRSRRLPRPATYRHQSNPGQGIGGRNFTLELACNDGSAARVFS
jgi:hypothetical protein